MLIHTPDQYDDPEYRRMILEKWIAEWEAAKVQLMDINNSPYYASPGWRVD